MKDFFTMFAHYNQDANKTIYNLLNTLSNDEREKPRGSYYNSISGLFRHLLSGTRFFLGMFKETLEGKTNALMALDALSTASLPKDTLTDEQWKALKTTMQTIDSTYLNVLNALQETDFSLQVKLNWYHDNPAQVPLSFMLSQLIAHGTHHRGQISQILDELKIDNDFSGIKVAFLPKPE